MYYDRNITNRLIRSFGNYPVVLLNGARQVGKSTLIEHMVRTSVEADYFSLDDHTALFAASQDPYGFLSQYDRPLAIDEVQRATDLLIAMKRVVDARQKPGQFLLTGSANIMTMPKVSESLAGRMIVHTLWPLSQGEILGKEESFIDWAFSSNGLATSSIQGVTQTELVEMIIKGGYPRSLAARDDMDRFEWSNAYLNAILQRDVRQLSNIEGLRELPHLLSIVGERVGNLLNLADLSRITGLQQMTLKRYYTLLQMVFLVVELPAWFTSREKRLAKMPKVYLNDTGLVCSLRQLRRGRLIEDRTLLGPLLENFVVMELKKQASWQDMSPQLYHFRDHMGNEVDIVMEGVDKRIVGIEVKAASVINNKDLKGLKKLQSIAGNSFAKGIVLYGGEQLLPLEKDLYAVPIHYLWGM